MQETVELNDKGQQYKKVVAPIMTEGLWVEINEMLTIGRPNEAIQLYVGDKLYVDTVEAFYKLKPLKVPVSN